MSRHRSDQIIFTSYGCLHWMIKQELVQLCPGHKSIEAQKPIYKNE